MYPFWVCVSIKAHQGPLMIRCLTNGPTGPVNVTNEFLLNVVTQCQTTRNRKIKPVFALASPQNERNVITSSHLIFYLLAWLLASPVGFIESMDIRKRPGPLLTNCDLII